MNMINLWNTYFRDKIFVFKNSKDVNESCSRLIASYLQARTAGHYPGTRQVWICDSVSLCWTGWWGHIHCLVSVQGCWVRGAVGLRLPIPYMQIHSLSSEILGLLGRIHFPHLTVCVSRVSPPTCLKPAHIQIPRCTLDLMNDNRMWD